MAVKDWDVYINPQAPKNPEPVDANTVTLEYPEQWGTTTSKMPSMRTRQYDANEVLSRYELHGKTDPDLVKQFAINGLVRDIENQILTDLSIDKRIKITENTGPNGDIMISARLQIDVDV